MGLDDLGEYVIIIGILVVIAAVAGLILELYDPETLEIVALAGTGVVFLGIIGALIGG